MPRNSSNILILFSLSCLILTGCSKSDDQQRFEDQAFVEPQGITETEADDTIIPNSEDPGDWNISPMYQGLITVQPTYPNPADFNSYFNINITINVRDVVSHITFWSFRFPDQLKGTGVELDQSMIHLGENIVAIPASSIAEGNAGASGIYRILVVDERENVITYGDVRVK